MPSSSPKQSAPISGGSGTAARDARKAQRKTGKWSAQTICSMKCLNNLQRQTLTPLLFAAGLAAGSPPQEKVSAVISGNSGAAAATRDDGEPAKNTKVCKCGNCADCTQRAALKKRKNKERMATKRAAKRAAGDHAEQAANTKARQEKRAAKRAAGDHAEQAADTKARQEKRAKKRAAGDERENERRRKRRAEHREQWKNDPTCKEFIKLLEVA